MSLRSLFSALLVAVPVVNSATISLTIPASVPTTAISPQLVANPVGVSIEFFAWPGYTNLSATTQCLANLKDVTGVWPPLRIGGTTQDRSTYAADQTQPVKYYVSKPADAPISVTFGQSFFDLASRYSGKVIVGLNRRLNNLSNTISAAKQAVSVMRNLESIELGNEPNFFNNTDPIAGGFWSASKDFQTEIQWQAALSTALGNKTSFISAGVFFDFSTFSIAKLSAVEAQSPSSLATVKDYCSHMYPQGGGNYNLTRLMSHGSIASNVAQFGPEAKAAHAQGKEYIIGETNSATQGGGGISPTFGAALWVMDYVLQSLIVGVKSLYFHQGTIGNCQYCWWSTNTTNSPYYGAYFATLALANATRIASLDARTGQYGAYAIYDSSSSSSSPVAGPGNATHSTSTSSYPARLLLYNSDYTASGRWSSQTWDISGLDTARGKGVVQVLRLTSGTQGAESRTDRGQVVTVGGRAFDGSCKFVEGQGEVREVVQVLGGRASVSVGASEAVIVYL